jgi:hypothetical protein
MRMAVSYERGTPVPARPRKNKDDGWEKALPCRGTSLKRNSPPLGPVGLCLEPYGGIREVGCFISARYPCVGPWHVGKRET